MTTMRDLNRRQFEAEALHFADWRYYDYGRDQYSWYKANQLDYGLAYNTKVKRSTNRHTQPWPNGDERGVSDHLARMEEYIREHAGDDIDVDALVHYLFNTEPLFEIAGDWLVIRPKHPDWEKLSICIWMKLGLHQDRQAVGFSTERKCTYGYEWNGNDIMNAKQIPWKQFVHKYGHPNSEQMPRVGYLPWRGDRTRDTFVHERSILRDGKSDIHNSAYHGKHLTARCMLSQKDVVDDMLKEFPLFYSIPHMVEFGDTFACCLSVYSRNGKCYRLLMNEFDKPNLRRLTVCKEELSEWAIKIVSSNSGVL